jgi:hypothetical protein
MKVITIKRTRGRKYPLILSAASEDGGPYFLADRAGYGVAWRKPNYAHHSLKRSDWLRVFQRALLAFELVESDEDLSPQTAKKIADLAFKQMGYNEPAKVERHAFHLLVKEARKGQK